MPFTRVIQPAPITVTLNDLNACKVVISPSGLEVTLEYTSGNEVVSIALSELTQAQRDNLSNVVDRIRRLAVAKRGLTETP